MTTPVAPAPRPCGRSRRGSAGPSTSSSATTSGSGRSRAAPRGRRRGRGRPRRTRPGGRRSRSARSTSAASTTSHAGLLQPGLTRRPRGRPHRRAPARGPRSASRTGCGRRRSPIAPDELGPARAVAHLPPAARRARRADGRPSSKSRSARAALALLEQRLGLRVDLGAPASSSRFSSPSTPSISRRSASPTRSRLVRLAHPLEQRPPAPPAVLKSSRERGEEARPAAAPGRRGCRRARAGARPRGCAAHARPPPRAAPPRRPAAGGSGRRGST